ncbi:long-chain fatty acid--CoA ligase [Arsenicicoccus sp. oral taxon 190]|nr:long-chain fatty acid--CoA ligase [Arsenicicoccus sp. oral taxon 190]
MAALAPEVARRTPDAVMARRRQGSQWVPVTATRLAAEIAELAKGFVAAGIQPGDRVALMSKTRYEWSLVDLALWTAGAVPVAVYDSSSASQLAWILEDSGAVGVVVEGRSGVSLVEEIADGLPALTHRWSIDPADGAESLDALRARGEGEADGDDELARRRAAMSRDDVATLIYTSGTTGRPKGCMLTHDNLLREAELAIERLPELFDDPDASCLFFLPLAHVLGRLMEVAFVMSATTVGHSDPGRVTVDLASLQPTFTVAVPRIFERIQDGARRKAAKDGKGRVFDLAAATAIRWSRAKQSGRVGPLLAAQHALFDRLVYGKIREVFGGRVGFVVSGGAPLGERLGHFFRGIGITVLEGYGLTETTGAATVNTRDELRIGSVGRPLPSYEARVDPHGELLVRGRHVFRGYWHDDAATAAVLDADGWFRTGDLARIDEDGYVYITGRVKEIIVTDSGKNVSPGPLEDVIRANPLVSQAVVVGDGRPAIGALITVDEEAVADWLRDQGRPAVPVAELVDDPALRAELQKAVDAANATVSSAERIVRFRLLPADLTEGSGHLTPTMKLKRNVVIRDFADDVDALYQRA